VSHPAADPAELQAEVVDVLQHLLRFDTTNPPGNEAPAQEYLAARLRDAGLEVTLAGDDPRRPNLVARLRGRAEGPVLGLLSHVDTVSADPAAWRHGPWSGALAEGCVWGRGALDMKSQTAAEVVAACTLARAGWRPARGDLIVISVCDEEVGGTGAEWLCAERPELVRCDWLLNEGDGVATPFGDERLYGVCVGEKGVFRFALTTEGVAGHASVPAVADNALLKLAPVLQALADREPGWDVTPGPRELLTRLGLPFDGDPGPALAALAERAPALAPTVAAMLRVTLAPTVISASQELNVIPASARLDVDCRVPPGLGEEAVLRRVAEVLAAGGAELPRLDFTERVTGNASPPGSALMEALERWVAAEDPGGRCVPTISPGYSDSRTMRDAFPHCTAYGFFPIRHMDPDTVNALYHSHDERIDVRDLVLATRCYRDVALDLLGQPEA
jgi:acetylornithine deacetylase/succinyl-diaminopimelate desuccinylase-like protein